MRRLALCCLLLIGLARSVAAETPPAGSPAALGQWPRLIVTQANRAAILTYIHTNYPTQFQNYLNRLNTPPGSSSAEIVIEGVWGPVNYGFPVALGIPAIQALGYTLPAAFDTGPEVCAAAYTYVTTDITDGTSSCTAGAPCRSAEYTLENNPPSFLQDASQHTYPMRATVTAYHLPAVLAFDWCHAEWSVPQKQNVANAFYEHYTEYWAPVNLLTTQIPVPVGAAQTMTNRWPAGVDSQLFALTAWGDTDILDSTKRQTLYDTFYTLWINRFIWEADSEGGHATFYEAYDYWAGYWASLIPPAMAAIDSALGTTYSADRALFSGQGTALAAWAWPHAMDRSTGCGASGTSSCFPFVHAWGDNNLTAATLLGSAGSCKGVMLTVGFERFMGFTTSAANGRWVYDHYLSTYSPSACAANTRVATAVTGSPWANDVFYFFLFGMEGITAATPTATVVPLLKGGYLFRDGYTQSSTSIWLGAYTKKSGGHDSYEHGNFSLYKNGPLIIKGPATRQGTCRADFAGTVGPNGIETNIIRNKVGVHKGASDTGWSSDKSVSADPAWAARGVGSAMNGPIALTPKASAGPNYNSVMLDESAMWTVATKMQRQAVYLRGAIDHEYLLLFDRANMLDRDGVDNVLGTADDNDPVWHAQVVAQPECVGVACTNPRTGMWATTGKVVSVTNTQGNTAAFGSGGWLLPPQAGKFFMKAVLPTDAEVQMVGDTGGGTLMYQTGNDTGAAFPFVSGASSCTAAHYDLFGWGRIEVRPATVQVANVFFNVFQFGAAATLTTMSDPTVAQNLGDPTWVVAHVNDDQRNWLVGFARDETHGPSPYARLGYAYEQSTPISNHLIHNLAPETRYFVASRQVGPRLEVDVAREDNGGTAYPTDANGVLYFTVAQPTRLLASLAN